MEWLRRFGNWSHRLISSSRLLARLYLGILRYLVKPLPDGIWKNRLLNSMQSTTWPSLRLPVAEIVVGNEYRVRLVPHPGEFDFAAHIYNRLRYEPEVFQWLEERDYDVVIEIGANVGIYTLFFSRRIPRGKVYAFEPSMEAYERLVANLRANGVHNVVAFPCAISDVSGFATFYEPKGHLTNGSLSPAFAGKFSDKLTGGLVVTVAGVELDQLVRPLNRILVKIDVEGAEYRVLRSLEKFITLHKPDMVVEVLDSSTADLNSLTYLQVRGYELYNLTPDGAVKQECFVATRFRDYACCPKDRA